MIEGKRTRAVRITDGAGAFLLALCPILQHYRGIGMGAAEEMLCLLLPYLVFRMLARRRLSVNDLLPLAAYAVYAAVSYRFDRGVVAREGLLLIYFAAAANNLGYIRRTFRASLAISVMAGVLIIGQYLCYYLLDFHLQLVPTRLLLESAGQWKALAKTGRISVTGSLMRFYRPSAFFLEPSHMALYLTPPLLNLLLSPGKTRRKKHLAVFLSLAMLLSTSGLGIAVVMLAWMVYGLMKPEQTEENRQRTKGRLKPGHIAFIGAFLVLFLVLYATVDLFRASIQRIFIGTAGENSAIQGRLSTGLRSLSHLSGFSLLFGTGKAVSLADWNMSGFFYTLYKHGLVGCILSYWFYFRCFRVLKREYFWLAVVVAGLSLFTVHTYAAFYRMYFVSFLLQGCSVCRTRSALDMFVQKLRKGIVQS